MSMAPVVSFWTFGILVFQHRIQAFYLQSIRNIFVIIARNFVFHVNVTFFTTTIIPRMEKSSRQNTTVLH